MCPQPQFGFVSRNPVLKNITDFLVEEGSYEEEELLGGGIDGEGKEENPEITVEKDPQLCQVNILLDGCKNYYCYY